MSTLNLTIREAFERYYETDELSENSIRKMQFEIGRWEQLTDDPVISTISNGTVAEFRSASIEAGYRPSTINSGWGTIRSILRRLGPPTDGNPWALGMLPRVPAMKPVKQVHRRPYRIPLDDLTAVYVSAKRAEYPRVGVLAADWWRALLVVAYTTALRRGDLFSLTWDQVDLDEMTMDFTARKTGKADLWPLHPAAVSHLKRIHRRAGLIFPGSRSTNGLFYRRLRGLQKHAGIKHQFGLHDIRRTAASEMERVRTGLGVEFLQHAPNDVSDVSYINRFDELRDALPEMRLPVGFKTGPKMSERAFEKERQQRIRLHGDDFKPRDKPLAEDWTFHPGGFTFRSVEYRMETSSRWKILKELATSDRAVTCHEIAEVLKREG